nr:MAG: polyprotein 1a [Trout granulomatous virus]
MATTWKTLSTKAGAPINVTTFLANKYGNLNKPLNHYPEFYSLCKALFPSELHAACSYIKAFHPTETNFNVFVSRKRTQKHSSAYNHVDHEEVTTKLFHPYGTKTYSFLKATPTSFILETVQSDFPELYLSIRLATNHVDRYTIIASAVHVNACRNNTDGSIHGYDPTDGFSSVNPQENVYYHIVNGKKVLGIFQTCGPTFVPTVTRTEPRGTKGFTPRAPESAPRPKPDKRYNYKYVAKMRTMNAPPSLNPNILPGEHNCVKYSVFSTNTFTVKTPIYKNNIQAPENLICYENVEHTQDCSGTYVNEREVAHAQRTKQLSSAAPRALNSNPPHPLVPTFGPDGVYQADPIHHPAVPPLSTRKYVRSAPAKTPKPTPPQTSQLKSSTSKATPTVRSKNSTTQPQQTLKQEIVALSAEHISAVTGFDDAAVAESFNKIETFFTIHDDYEDTANYHLRANYLAKTPFEPLPKQPKGLPIAYDYLRALEPRPFSQLTGKFPHSTDLANSTRPRDSDLLQLPIPDFTSITTPFTSGFETSPFMEYDVNITQRPHTGATGNCLSKLLMSLSKMIHHKASPVTTVTFEHSKQHFVALEVDGMVNLRKDVPQAPTEIHPGFFSFRSIRNLENTTYANYGYIEVSNSPHDGHHLTSELGHFDQESKINSVSHFYEPHDFPIQNPNNQYYVVVRNPNWKPVPSPKAAYYAYPHATYFAYHHQFWTDVDSPKHTPIDKIYGANVFDEFKSLVVGEDYKSHLSSFNVPTLNEKIATTNIPIVLDVLRHPIRRVSNSCLSSYRHDIILTNYFKRECHTRNLDPHQDFVFIPAMLLPEDLPYSSFMTVSYNHAEIQYSTPGEFFYSSQASWATYVPISTSNLDYTAVERLTLASYYVGSDQPKPKRRRRIRLTNRSTLSPMGPIEPETIDFNYKANFPITLVSKPYFMANFELGAKSLEVTRYINPRPIHSCLSDYRQNIIRSHGFTPEETTRCLKPHLDFIFIPGKYVPNHYRGSSFVRIIKNHAVPTYSSGYFFYPSDNEIYYPFSTDAIKPVTSADTNFTLITDFFVGMDDIPEPTHKHSFSKTALLKENSMNYHLSYESFVKGISYTTKDKKVANGSSRIYQFTSQATCDKIEYTFTTKAAFSDNNVTMTSSISYSGPKYKVDKRFDSLYPIPFPSQNPDFDPETLCPTICNQLHNQYVFSILPVNTSTTIIFDNCSIQNNGKHSPDTSVSLGTDFRSFKTGKKQSFPPPDNFDDWIKVSCYGSYASMSYILTKGFHPLPGCIYITKDNQFVMSTLTAKKNPIYTYPNTEISYSFIPRTDMILPLASHFYIGNEKLGSVFTNLTEDQLTALTEPSYSDIYGDDIDTSEVFEDYHLNYKFSCRYLVDHDQFSNSSFPSIFDSDSCSNSSQILESPPCSPEPAENLMDHLLENLTSPSNLSNDASPFAEDSTQTSSTADSPTEITSAYLPQTPNQSYYTLDFPTNTSGPGDDLTSQPDDTNYILDFPEDVCSVQSNLDNILDSADVEPPTRSSSVDDLTNLNMQPICQAELEHPRSPSPSPSSTNDFSDLIPIYLSNTSQHQFLTNIVHTYVTNNKFTLSSPTTAAAILLIQDDDVNFIDTMIDLPIHVPVYIFKFTTTSGCPNFCHNSRVASFFPIQHSFASIHRAELILIVQNLLTNIQQHHASLESPSTTLYSDTASSINLPTVIEHLKLAITISSQTTFFSTVTQQPHRPNHSEFVNILLHNRSQFLEYPNHLLSTDSPVTFDDTFNAHTISLPTDCYHPNFLFNLSEFSRFLSMPKVTPRREVPHMEITPIPEDDTITALLSFVDTACQTNSSYKFSKQDFPYLSVPNGTVFDLKLQSTQVSNSHQELVNLLTSSIKPCVIVSSVHSDYFIMVQDPCYFFGKQSTKKLHGPYCHDPTNLAYTKLTQQLVHQVPVTSAQIEIPDYHASALTQQPNSLFPIKKSVTVGKFSITPRISATLLKHAGAEFQLLSDPTKNPVLFYNSYKIYYATPTHFYGPYDLFNYNTSTTIVTPIEPIPALLTSTNNLTLQSDLDLSYQHQESSHDLTTPLTTLTAGTHAAKIILINLHAQPHSLDIGSGKGSDVFRFVKSGVKHLTMLEPHPPNYDLLANKCSNLKIDHVLHQHTLHDYLATTPSIPKPFVAYAFNSLHYGCNTLSPDILKLQSLGMETLVAITPNHPEAISQSEQLPFSVRLEGNKIVYEFSDSRGVVINRKVEDYISDPFFLKSSLDDHSSSVSYESTLYEFLLNSPHRELVPPHFQHVFNTIGLTDISLSRSLSCYNVTVVKFSTPQLPTSPQQQPKPAVSITTTEVSEPSIVSSSAKPSTLQFCLNDISALNNKHIVNAANPTCSSGSGVTGAIYNRLAPNSTDPHGFLKEIRLAKDSSQLPLIPSRPIFTSHKTGPYKSVIHIAAPNRNIFPDLPLPALIDTYSKLFSTQSSDSSPIYFPLLGADAYGWTVLESLTACVTAFETINPTQQFVLVIYKQKFCTQSYRILVSRLKHIEFEQMLSTYVATCLVDGLVLQLKHYEASHNKTQISIPLNVISLFYISTFLRHENLLQLTTKLMCDNGATTIETPVVNQPWRSDIVASILCSFTPETFFTCKCGKFSPQYGPSFCNVCNAVTHFGNDNPLAIYHIVIDRALVRKFISIVHVGPAEDGHFQIDTPSDRNIHVVSVMRNTAKQDLAPVTPRPTYSSSSPGPQTSSTSSAASTSTAPSNASIPPSNPTNSQTGYGILHDYCIKDGADNTCPLPDLGAFSFSVSIVVNKDVNGDIYNTLTDTKNLYNFNSDFILQHIKTLFTPVESVLTTSSGDHLGKIIHTMDHTLSSPDRFLFFIDFTTILEKGISVFVPLFESKNNTSTTVLFNSSNISTAYSVPTAANPTSHPLLNRLFLKEIHEYILTLGLPPAKLQYSFGVGLDSSEFSSSNYPQLLSKTLPNNKFFSHPNDKSETPMLLKPDVSLIFVSEKFTIKPIFARHGQNLSTSILPTFLEVSPVHKHSPSVKFGFIDRTSETITPDGQVLNTFKTKPNSSTPYVECSVDNYDDPPTFWQTLVRRYNFSWLCLFFTIFSQTVIKIGDSSNANHYDFFIFRFYYNTNYLDRAGFIPVATNTHGRYSPFNTYSLPNGYSSNSLITRKTQNDKNPIKNKSIVYTSFFHLAGCSVASLVLALFVYVVLMIACPYYMFDIVLTGFYLFLLRSLTTFYDSCVLSYFNVGSYHYLKSKAAPLIDGSHRYFTTQFSQSSFSIEFRMPYTSTVFTVPLTHLLTSTILLCFSLTSYCVGVTIGSGTNHVDSYSTPYHNFIQKVLVATGLTEPLTHYYTFASVTEACMLSSTMLCSLGAPRNFQFPSEFLFLNPTIPHQPIPMWLYLFSCNPVGLCTFLLWSMLSPFFPVCEFSTLIILNIPLSFAALSYLIKLYFAKPCCSRNVTCIKHIQLSKSFDIYGLFRHTCSLNTNDFCKQHNFYCPNQHRGHVMPKPIASQLETFYNLKPGTINPDQTWTKYVPEAPTVDGLNSKSLSREYEVSNVYPQPSTSTQELTLAFIAFTNGIVLNISSLVSSTQKQDSQPSKPTFDRKKYSYTSDSATGTIKKEELLSIKTFLGRFSDSRHSTLLEYLNRLIISTKPTILPVAMLDYFTNLTPKVTKRILFTTNTTVDPANRGMLPFSYQDYPTGPFLVPVVYHEDIVASKIDDSTLEVLLKTHVVVKTPPTPQNSFFNLSSINKYFYTTCFILCSLFFLLGVFSTVSKLQPSHAGLNPLRYSSTSRQPYLQESTLADSNLIVYQDSPYHIYRLTNGTLYFTAVAEHILDCPNPNSMSISFSPENTQTCHGTKVTYPATLRLGSFYLMKLNALTSYHSNLVSMTPDRTTFCIKAAQMSVKCYSTMLNSATASIIPIVMSTCALLTLLFAYLWLWSMLKFYTNTVLIIIFSQTLTIILITLAPPLAIALQLIILAYSLNSYLLIAQCILNLLMCCNTIAGLIGIVVSTLYLFYKLYRSYKYSSVILLDNGISFVGTFDEVANETFPLNFANSCKIMTETHVNFAQLNTLRNSPNKNTRGLATKIMSYQLDNDSEAVVYTPSYAMPQSFRRLNLLTTSVNHKQYNNLCIVQSDLKNGQVSLQSGVFINENTVLTTTHGVSGNVIVKHEDVEYESYISSALNDVTTLKIKIQNPNVMNLDIDLNFNSITSPCIIVSPTDLETSYPVPMCTPTLLLPSGHFSASLTDAGQSGSPYFHETKLVGIHHGIQSLSGSCIVSKPNGLSYIPAYIPNSNDYCPPPKYSLSILIDSAPETNLCHKLTDLLSIHSKIKTLCVQGEYHYDISSSNDLPKLTNLLSYLITNPTRPSQQQASRLMVDYRATKSSKTTPQALLVYNANKRSGFRYSTALLLVFHLMIFFANGANNILPLLYQLMLQVCIFGGKSLFHDVTPVQSCFYFFATSWFVSYVCTLVILFVYNFQVPIIIFTQAPMLVGFSAALIWACFNRIQRSNPKMFMSLTIQIFVYMCMTYNSYVSEFEGVVPSNNLSFVQYLMYFIRDLGHMPASHVHIPFLPFLMRSLIVTILLPNPFISCVLILSFVFGHETLALSIILFLASRLCPMYLRPIVSFLTDDTLILSPTQYSYLHYYNNKHGKGAYPFILAVYRSILRPEVTMVHFPVNEPFGTPFTHAYVPDSAEKSTPKSDASPNSNTPKIDTPTDANLTPTPQSLTTKILYQPETKFVQEFIENILQHPGITPISSVDHTIDVHLGDIPSPNSVNVHVVQTPVTSHYPHYYISPDLTSEDKTTITTMLKDAQENYVNLSVASDAMCLALMKATIASDVSDSTILNSYLNLTTVTTPLLVQFFKSYSKIVGTEKDLLTNLALSPSLPSLDAMIEKDCTNFHAQAQKSVIQAQYAHLKSVCLTSVTPQSDLAMLSGKAAELDKLDTSKFSPADLKAHRKQVNIINAEITRLTSMEVKLSKFLDTMQKTEVANRNRSDVLTKVSTMLRTHLAKVASAGHLHIDTPLQGIVQLSSLFQLKSLCITQPSNEVLIDYCEEELVYYVSFDGKVYTCTDPTTANGVPLVAPFDETVYPICFKLLALDIETQANSGYVAKHIVYDVEHSNSGVLLKLGNIVIVEPCSPKHSDFSYNGKYYHFCSNSHAVASRDDFTNIYSTLRNAVLSQRTIVRIGGSSHSLNHSAISPYPIQTNGYITYAGISICKSCKDKIPHNCLYNGQFVQLPKGDFDLSKMLESGPCTHNKFLCEDCKTYPQHSTKDMSFLNC